MPDIMVEYRKWPERLHYRTEMAILGEDSAGIWAGSRRGAEVVRADGRTNVFSTDAVTLFPPDQAWSARWYAAQAASGRAATYRLYVDIATPAARTDAGLHLVDLDLDVGLTWEDEVVRLDEDEFAERRTVLDYPDALCRQAVDAFDEMHKAVTLRTFPLDGSADAYLDAWFNR
jgi:protein associated with RNAse G/E